jgi:hypothetical protein
MRRSTTPLVPGHFKAPHTTLLLLSLFTVLVTSSPATAQKEATPVATRTTVYTGYAKGVAVEKETNEVTIPVKVTPNPTMGSFRAKMYGSKEEQVRIEILDRHGRIIDARQVSGQAELRFGYWYHPGTYFLHIIQGENRKKIKLVKLAE